MKKTCAICGKPSGMYPLCPECFKLRDEGKITKCKDCGTWHYSDNPCPKCKKEQPKTECLICKTITENGDFCKNCFTQIKTYSESIDKNQDITEIQDYYFNLKSSLWSYSEHFFYVSLYKMAALALMAKNQFERNSLYNRLKDDILTSIEKRNQRLAKIEESNKNNELSPNKKIKEQKELENRRIIKTDDGHKVLSDGEKNIDNILYALRIPHSYGQEIPFINIEENKYCDFFIPIKNDHAGIYIEYWGIDDKPDYLKNKEIKKQAYKDENLAFISIEKDEPLTDSQNFKMRLLKEINKLAKQHFGVDSFIKN